MNWIYLDNASTTCGYAEVAREMEKWLLKEYGNPSSSHQMGDEARKALDEARGKLASKIGAKPEEIIFTSGATESNNLAILGLAKAYPKKKKIIISSIEHDSVYEPCQHLKSWGYKIVEIPVNREGFVDLNELEKEIDRNTLLVSIIHGHNEFGTIQDIQKIGGICRKKGGLFHTDAVQTFGKENINARGANISLLSASAHKIGGPKGVGFLYVQKGIKIEPIIYGGGQERGVRSGTENVPGIAGFAKALEITEKIDKNKVREMRDYFMEELQKMGGKVRGSREKRLFNNVHVCFSGAGGEMVAEYLSERGIMCSTRSACSSKQKKENRVLKALGLHEKEIRGALRLGLNEKISRKEIRRVLNCLTKALNVYGEA